MQIARPILLGGLLGIVAGAGATAGVILGPSLAPMARNALEKSLAAAGSMRPAWPRQVQDIQDLRQEPDSVAQT